MGSGRQVGGRQGCDTGPQGRALPAACRRCGRCSRASCSPELGLALHALEAPAGPSSFPGRWGLTAPAAPCGAGLLRALAPFSPCSHQPSGPSPQTRVARPLLLAPTVPGITQHRRPLSCLPHLRPGEQGAGTFWNPCPWLMSGDHITALCYPLTQDPQKCLLGFPPMPVRALGTSGTPARVVSSAQGHLRVAQGAGAGAPVTPVS